MRYLIDYNKLNIKEKKLFWILNIIKSLVPIIIIIVAL